MGAQRLRQFARCHGGASGGQDPRGGTPPQTPKIDQVLRLVGYLLLLLLSDFNPAKMSPSFDFLRVGYLLLLLLSDFNPAKMSPSFDFLRRDLAAFHHPKMKMLARLQVLACSGPAGWLQVHYISSGGALV